MNALSPLARWRRAYVLGLGLSGTAAARLLRAHGVAVVGADRRGGEELDLGELAADPSVELRLGRDEGAPPPGVDLVVVSPGVSPAHPLLAAARVAGIEVLGEVDLAALVLDGPVGAITGSNGKSTTTAMTGALLAGAGLAGIEVLGEVDLAALVLDGPVGAITGSNGKSTTTAMTGALLAGAGLAVEVCGNIGRPLASAVEGEPGRRFVVELSSFQLEMLRHLRPRAAALLNLSPDHLDRHGDLAGYLAAKRRIFALQRPDDVAVLNADDPPVLATLVPGRRRLFSCRGPVDDGCFLDGDVVRERDGAGEGELFRAIDVPLPGPHNVENAMAAALLALALGAPRESLAASLRDFRGLPHRLERVGERGGVAFYDDSKGTNVAATARSLESFADASVHLVLGGRNKGADFRLLRDVVARKAKRIYLIGESAPELAQALAGAADLVASGTLATAVEEAASRAHAGESVVLSPACASFDQFRDFADRGRSFQRLVRELVGVETAGRRDG